MLYKSTLRYLLLLLLGALTGAGCSSKNQEEVLPAGKHRVLIRLSARALQGLDAQYTFSRQAADQTVITPITGGVAQNNATQDIDAGIQNTGDVTSVEISFRAITPTSSPKPDPAASYTVEIIVDGTVKTSVTINAASKLNNSFYLAAVALAEAR